MSGGYDWDSGAERADNVEDSRPTRVSSPAIPRLTSTLLMPTTIPTARALEGDVVRATDVVRPMRPARGTRPMLRSSLATRANVLSSIRDRSIDSALPPGALRAPAKPGLASDPLPLDAAAESAEAMHDPNNEAPAARRSSLAISGSRRGMPSSLTQRSHMFASIRDRSRHPVLEQPTELSENRTPEE